MKLERKITFAPSGRTVYALDDTPLFEVAARAGLLLQSPCGGNGTCGKCGVRISKGECPPTDACKAVFEAEKLRQGYRLACQARVVGDCVVHIPDSSLYDHRSQILTSTDARSVDGKPAVWKKFVELPAPTSQDPVADLKRLERIIGKLHVHLDSLQELPLCIRRGDFSGTAVVCCSQLLAFEAGNTEKFCYGIAFDIGTTTIVGALLDLAHGREVAVSAAMNPQISLGDDVISRITRTREQPGAVAELQKGVAEIINELIQDLCRQAEIDPAFVYEISVAGNTTMQHLFCGISPAALGEVPFPPVFSRALFLRTREVNLQVHPNARLFIFPNIGGFIGGDTIAGILANSLQRSEHPALFVDIGTNGEIVLAHGGKLYATSTAAGPAFEGARIKCGMRATVGAIEKVIMNDDDIAYNVIGNSAPAGLCGTALIDLTAVLLDLGIIDTTGRILPPAELTSAVPAAVRARLQVDGNDVNFLIADAESSRTGEPLYLYQRDIRELQLATGAIRAGVNLMLRRADLTPADLECVLLAGGFGNFIRRGNARRIGLLPNIPTSKIRFVGNASLAGTKAVLLSEEQRDIAQAIADSAEHVDLSLDPEFQMEFGMSMMFPES